MVGLSMIRGWVCGTWVSRSVRTWMNASLVCAGVGAAAASVSHVEARRGEEVELDFFEAVVVLFFPMAGKRSMLRCVWWAGS